MATPIIASIIIPVANDDRNSSLTNLLQRLDQQTIENFEVILIIGDNRQGRAINHGVERARGKWIITMDDDTGIISDSLLKDLIDGMGCDPTIGMGGAACVIPEDASTFQRRAMLEIPRRYFPKQSITVDSDFVQHPCLILSRKLFNEIGGEDEELIRGLDPVLRKKVRDRGLRVAILANTAVVHLLPGNIGELFRMYHRNGRGSSFAQRHYPERIVELGSGHEREKFIERRPILYRIVRRPLLMLGAILQCQWIRLITDIGYCLGWFAGYLSRAEPEDPAPPFSYEEDEPESRRRFKLRRIRVLL